MSNLTSRPPLLRPARRDGTDRGQGRIIAGVAAGLGAHLKISPWVLRLLFLLFVFTGFGPLLYLWFWAFVPVGNPWLSQVPEPENSRLARPLESVENKQKLKTTPAVLLALGLIALAAVGAWMGPEALLAGKPILVAVLILAGMALVWGGAVNQEHLNLSRFLILGIPGCLFMILGVTVWTGGTFSWPDALKGVLFALAVLALLTLACLPLWARLLRSYKASLAEQTRQSVRADMAAHLHDSVLQTLALIRARATDPIEVAKLARAEERQLRQWLYTDRIKTNDSLAQQLKDLVGEVEDRWGVVVETVTVGDATPGDWSEPLVAATREALNNAAKHGAPAFSLYLEIGPEKAQCFVRDHGQGFCVEDIPEGHLGVRESILNRLERHGGKALVKSSDIGTEIEMEVKKQ